MLSEATLQQSQDVLDKAANDISNLGLTNVQISEIFFAYALRIGVLTEGLSVLKTARMMIDAMEKQSTGEKPTDH